MKLDFKVMTGNFHSTKEEFTGIIIFPVFRTFLKARIFSFLNSYQSIIYKNLF
jgi:hypothetical protein